MSRRGHAALRRMAAGSRPAISTMRSLKATLAAYAMAAVLVLCAIGFLAWAAQLQLAEVIGPGKAALATGLMLLGLALVILLGVHLSRRRSSRRDYRSRHPLDGLEDTLERRIDPLISAQLRRHPQRAALVTLLLGLAAGYSRTVGVVAQDLYDKYVDTESERRASRRR